jgi:peptide/nickel transport system permease protein
LRAVLRRLVQLVVVLVVVTFFTALLTELLPGDPVTTIAPFATDEQRDDIRSQLRLDQNVVSRYVDWLGDFVTGDFGEYFNAPGLQGHDVFKDVKKNLPTSMTLMLYVQVLTLLIAVPLGVTTAYRADSRYDRWANGLAFGLVAIPAFVLGTTLKYWFAVRYQVFDTRGWSPLSEGFSAHYKTAVLPVVALAVGQIAAYSRLLRSDMVATLQEDFILMAKAKGIPNRRILWRHALRPSSLTLLTVAGLNIGALISGALIVETIFAIDGIGSLILVAIQTRQYIALQSFVAIVVIIYVLVNFLVDMLYTVLDPRIRNV